MIASNFHETRIKNSKFTKYIFFCKSEIYKFPLSWGESYKVISLLKVLDKIYWQVVTIAKLRSDQKPSNRKFLQHFNLFLSHHINIILQFIIINHYTIYIWVMSVMWMEGYSFSPIKWYIFTFFEASKVFL